MNDPSKLQRARHKGLQARFTDTGVKCSKNMKTNFEVLLPKMLVSYSFQICDFFVYKII